MTSQYRHRRTSNPATPAPNPLEPGEIAVNTANRQLHLGDAASATLGAPKPLLPIRYFDTTAQYVANDFVVNGDSLYRAKTFTGPGVFVAANWDMMVGTIDPQYVAKAGDTMTGALSLPAAAPIAPVHATNKAYVDALVALKANVIVSPTKPSPDPNDSTLWYDSQGGQLYIRYNDGNSTAWVIAAPQPDSSNYVSLIGSSAVRYDAAQALTDPQKVQGRQNIYAAPFDALAYNGLQVNGSMEVSQELGQVGRTTQGYVCDGWNLSFVGAMAIGANQINSPGAFPGFTSFLQITVITPAPALAAGDYVFLSTAIEACRTQRLSWGTAVAQPITIGFWVAHHRTGVYTGTIRNGTITRAYGFSYTQNVSDALEYKTVTIPGDVTGTWTADPGINISFAMACGTTFTTPSLNTWVAGNYVAAPGQVNAAAAASVDYFRITGVVVLPGIEAPSAARSALIMRPYDQELLTCQRYYQKLLSAIMSGVSVVPGQGSYVDWQYAIKRAGPTVSFANVSYTNASGLAISGSPKIDHVWLTTSPISTSTYYAIFDIIVDARL